MIRMSDIIKLGDSRRDDARNKAAVKESRKDDIPKIVKEAQLNRAKIGELNDRGMSLIKGAADTIRSNTPINTEPILKFIKELTDSLLVSEEEFFDFFYKPPPPDNYLPLHSTNVCFLSAKLGLWVGINKSELAELALCGFLHDLGMIKVEDIALKEGRLSQEDYRQIEKHPEYSASILGDTGLVSEKGILAIMAHHIKGHGDKFFQILRLADIFEAITHPRVYRKAKLPHETIAEILSEESKNFKSEILRALINNIGLYPVGSWVKLNTGEVGVITGANRNYPLRPRLNIVFNSAGGKMANKRPLDLSIEEPHSYIDSPIDITAYNNDKK